MDTSILAWGVPLFIAVLQIYLSKQERTKDKETREQQAKWASLQQFLEQNNVGLDLLEKEVGRLQVEVTRLEGKFIPRSELNEIIDRIEERLESKLSDSLRVTMAEFMLEYSKK